MVTKTLVLSLGSISAMQVTGYTTGWYRDPITGERYYYDAATGKWYLLVSGLLYPLSIDYLSPPKQLSIIPGDRVKITISYKYSGPAVTGVEERFVIGYEIAGILQEALVDTNTRSLPQSSTPLTYTGEKTLTIPSSVGSNWTVLECKVSGGTPTVPERGVRYRGAFVVTGLVPEITEFTIIDFIKV